MISNQLLFTTIEGQGHDWPGGKIALPQWIAGKSTHRLRATDAIWDFFQAHPKAG